MDSDSTLTPSLGIGLGAVLVVLGVAAYVITDFASVTALIPALFGVIMIAFGYVGRTTDRTDLAVYGIAALAILGIAGSGQGVPDLIALATGDDVDSVAAPLTQGAMIVAGLVLLGAAVRDALEHR